MGGEAVLWGHTRREKGGGSGVGGTQRRRRAVDYGSRWRLGWIQLMNDPECCLGKSGLSLWATGSPRRFKGPGD